MEQLNEQYHLHVSGWERELLSQEPGKGNKCKLSCCTSQYGSTHVIKDGVTEWTVTLACGSDTEVYIVTEVLLLTGFLGCFKIKKNRTFEKTFVIDTKQMQMTILAWLKVLVVSAIIYCSARCTVETGGCK